MDSPIYNFLDYREYLKFIFEQRKKEFNYFSYSYFAKAADVGSHSYLRMVIKGERNITTKSIHKFAQGLKLTKKETVYFETLVNFNQTTSETEKDLFFERLKRLRPKKFVQKLHQDQYEYFTHRYFVTIREMVALKNFKEDPSWIGSQLSPTVKPGDVKQAIKVLLKLGLLKRDASRKLQHSHMTLSTIPEVTSTEIYEYKYALLKEAKESILSRPKELVDMLSVTVPIPIKQLPQIKEIIGECKDEILKLVGKSRHEYDEVFQINLSYYPLTKASDE